MLTPALVPVFIFFLVFQRLLIEGIATTGMKRWPGSTMNLCAFSPDLFLLSLPDEARQ